MTACLLSHVPGGQTRGLVEYLEYRSRLSPSWLRALYLGGALVFSGLAIQIQ